jgi:DNA-binding transcriptional LysR family regulator
MQNLRIYTSDFLSFCFLEPVLTKLLREDKSVNFEIFCSESQHLSDFDAYFLGYEMPIKDFEFEMIQESKICLYANSHYLERFGEPKQLADLLHHNIIRCKDTHVVQALGVKKFGTVKEYVPLFYKKQCIEVDSANSQLNLGEMGLGLIPMTDLLYKRVKTKLLRIPLLKGEEAFVYRRYTFGYHQKHRSNQFMGKILAELKDVLYSYSEANLSN